MDAIFHPQPQEESTQLTDLSPEEDMLDDEDLDKLGYDQQIIDDIPPDEE
jgi:hypothetical protein